MKFIVDRDEMVKGLDLLPNIQNNITPILNTILIEAKKELMLKVTDTYIYTHTKVEAEIEEPGVVCVPSKSLFKLVRELPKGKYTFELAKTYLIIKNKNIKLKIRIFSPEEIFPESREFEISKTVKLQAKKLSSMLTHTAMCMGVSIGFDINGTLFKLGNKLSLVTCDGVRLARAGLNEKETINVIIPHRAVKEIEKITKDNELDVKIQLSAENNKIQIDVGDTRCVSILIDMVYPDYEKFIPKKNKNILIVDREELMSSLNRAKLIGESETDNPIKLKLTKNLLNVSRADDRIGEFEENLKVDYSGKDVILGFQAYTLVDVLELLTHEKLSFEINENPKPVAIRLDDYLYLALPVRIK